MYNDNTIIKYQLSSVDILYISGSHNSDPDI